MADTLATPPAAAPTDRGPNAADPNAPSHPGGPLQRVVSSYGNYAEAQRAVDYLSDNDFPVQKVTIVGQGLRFVEQVTGRLNWGRAALSGLFSGAWTGLFVGLVIGLFFPFANGGYWYAVGTCLVIGAVFGLAAGLVGYALSGGKRDFTSTGTMEASRYDIYVDADHAEKAEEMLRGM